MKIETIFKIVGAIVILLSILNLSLVLLNDEFRASAISLPAVLFRSSYLIPVGIGMILFRKWSVYFLVVGMIIGWVIFFTVYGGQSDRPIWVGLIGSIFWTILFYKAWPKLK